MPGRRFLVLGDDPVGLLGPLLGLFPETLEFSFQSTLGSLGFLADKLDFLLFEIEEEAALFVRPLLALLSFDPELFLPGFGLPTDALQFAQMAIALGLLIALPAALLFVLPALEFFFFILPTLVLDSALLFPAAVGDLLLLAQDIDHHVVGAALAGVLDARRRCLMHRLDHVEGRFHGRSVADLLLPRDLEAGGVVLRRPLVDGPEGRTFRLLSLGLWSLRVPGALEEGPGGNLRALRGMRRRAGRAVAGPDLLDEFDREFLGRIVLGHLIGAFAVVLTQLFDCEGPVVSPEQPVRRSDALDRVLHNLACARKSAGSAHNGPPA